MIDFTCTAQVDTTRLDAELRAVYGARLVGVSTAGDAVRIHLIGDVIAPEVQDAITAMVTANAVKTASGYYRALPLLQAQSAAFVAAYRAKIRGKTTTFKERMKAIQ